jgi:hypothetical protein
MNVIMRIFAHAAMHRHSSASSNVKLEMRLAIDGQAMVAAAAAAATELGLLSSFFGG